MQRGGYARAWKGRRGRGWVLGVLICWVWVGTGVGVGAEGRPNILWITAEDINPNLGCYGDAYARTPVLDRLASRGVLYTRAFATAPVCSPARSALITGLYATTLNTAHLRSRFPIPEEFKGFPTYLRELGYYCSNNAKTDYNTSREAAIIQASWDESSPRAHWRKRKPGQPFFSVFNLMTTHQSWASVWSFEEFERRITSLLKPEERHDPGRAPVPPYYPDTPTVRRTLARYYDCITAMDKEVGRLLDELEEDGLSGETIVFFFGDNGAGLPRHKRLLYDSGLRVPLLIRFPEKWRGLAPAEPGQAVERLVSFVDFGPTALSLAGAVIPRQMQGVAFLGGAAGPAREYVYGARDRVDEAYDLSRSVRDGRFLYIRNYMPHLSFNQPEGYSDQAEIRREITRLAAAGQLNAVQLGYAGPGKALEELYDTETDPDQIRNLALSPAYWPVMERMRERHQLWLVETRDLGYLPEADAWERSRGTTPWAMARDGMRYPEQEITAAADGVGRAEAVEQQARLLGAPDSAVRYWAAVGLRAAGAKAGLAREPLRRALHDKSAPVRIEAAGTLILLGEAQDGLRVLVEELSEGQPDAALCAARTLQLLGGRARPALEAMQLALAKAAPQANTSDQNLNLKFSLEAAIRELGH